jgi:hypothetical protein
LFSLFAAVLLGACSPSQPLTAGQNREADKPLSQQEPDKTTEHPDPAALAKLLKQLGSSNFRERDAATKALAAIGLPALETLRKTAKDGDAEIAQRAAQLVQAIENSFAQYLADYRAYGLPLPPKNATLVRFESGGRSILNGKLMPPTYFLGFLLQPETKETPPLLLVGTQEYRLEARNPVEAVEPKVELVRGLDLRWWGRATFDMNAGLALALQCKARGWHDLAQALWTASIQQDGGDRFAAFYQPANLPGRTAVAYLAWAYSGNEQVQPRTDRSKTASRMKALLAAEPRLNTEVHRKLLRSLEATLVPSKAKPGTVEWLIDDLTEMCDTRSTMRSPGEIDERYFRLVRRGFAAVPAMIEHLDDERLTRSVMHGSDNFPTWMLRVQHVVSDLLQQLAGEDVSQDWLRRQQGWAVEKADAQAWWDKARQLGEEAYFLKHVLPNGDKERWPKHFMLSIIGEKYPGRLPNLYRTVLDERPKVQSWTVAEAVEKSSLSAEKQRQLFLYAAQHKDLEHRRVGLWYLQKLDPKQFMTILLATLDALPKSPAEPYWHCREAAMALLVLRTDDARAWKLLEKVAKRSDVGLRMELLNRMNLGYGEGRHRQQRLHLLAAFLDDAEAPDVKANPEMFRGPHAGFGFTRLSVQDLAAMTIASILEMPDHSDLNWTPEQWEKLRTQVKQALKR